MDEFIDKGAHGSIFKAYDMVEKITLAVKLMEREKERDKHNIKFTREVDLLKKVN